MKTFESKWQSNDGIDFFLRGWEPESRPRAVIALIHGLDEHTGRYEHVAKALTDAGYALTGFDLRGHGRSGGIRGHFPSLDAVMQDIRDFFRFLTERYPDESHFLYGHSLGGLLALTYILRSRIGLKGMVVTGPALRSPIHDQKVKALMARVLGSIAPTVLIPNELEVTDISHDPAVITAYMNDPLVHDRISLGFGKTGLSATEFTWKHAGEFSLPLLIMHGTDDRVTYPSGSRDFAELAVKNNQDVLLKLWDGMYHEVHNEPQKEQVFEFMIDWLDRHS